jgi:hypothetical protein
MWSIYANLPSVQIQVRPNLKIENFYIEVRKMDVEVRANFEFQQQDGSSDGFRIRGGDATQWAMKCEGDYRGIRSLAMDLPESCRSPIQQMWIFEELIGLRVKYQLLTHEYTIKFQTQIGREDDEIEESYIGAFYGTYTRGQKRVEICIKHEDRDLRSLLKDLGYQISTDGRTAIYALEWE